MLEANGGTTDLVYHRLYTDPIAMVSLCDR
jgi:hypothetical protein